MGDPKQAGKLLNILWRCLGLAIEDGRCGYLIAADVLGDLLEAELPGCFGLEEGC